jgi:protein phosphatase
MKPLIVPELSIVALVGITGSGKSSFARKHFRPSEVLSSDHYRGVVADDEMDQSATEDAFDVLHYIAGKRLAAGRLAVVDATNVQPDSRRPIIALARQYHAFPVAIVLDVPEKLAEERNRERPNRQFGPHVIRNQHRALRRSMRSLAKEGFRYVYVLSDAEEIDAAVIERQPLWNDKRTEAGPFDIIGDVHGCADELEELLELLGYQVTETRDGTSLAAGPVYSHPDGRKTVFLGDLVDRGPRVLDCLRIAHNMVDGETAFAVAGNHEAKLLRALNGRNVQVTHGLGQSLAEIDALDESDREQLVAELKPFLDGLISHYVLDRGRLVVAHAGLKESMQGRGSRAVREFALYGDTTGETDEFGLPVRLDWAADYRGQATVVYGHTPVPEPEWTNNTINIDTGCVFGGSLTALRYPERELVSVRARRTYYEPARPFLAAEAQAEATPAAEPNTANFLIDLSDVTGRKIVETRLAGKVTIREENAAAALEVMSRFAVDPRWLVYMPPTMSPSETSVEADLLEHPADALNYYRQSGVGTVVAEQKHMGSRAIVIVGRDPGTVGARFGIATDAHGIVYTRTGRRFFDQPALEAEFLARLADAVNRAGTWHSLSTDWLLLDAELMPWSFKAQELLERQYAPVGAAARTALPAAVATLEQAASAGVPVDAVLEHVRARADVTEAYAAAYRRYAWPVTSLDDLKLAPFHVLASEGHVYVGKDHTWHMDQLKAVTDADPKLLLETPHRLVDVTNDASMSEAVQWWFDLTESGGEGIVVKPLDFVVRGPRGLVQPAVKVRGREYLRIIYGPEYTLPANLERLRERGLGAKRALAVREFALGVEGLERFVRREPLRRVHECAFAVLALESEPVDPRL